MAEGVARTRGEKWVFPGAWQGPVALNGWLNPPRAGKLCDRTQTHTLQKFAATNSWHACPGPDKGEEDGGGHGRDTATEALGWQVGGGGGLEEEGDGRRHGDSAN